MLNILFILAYGQVKGVHSMPKNNFQKSLTNLIYVPIHNIVAKKQHKIKTNPLICV